MRLSCLFAALGLAAQCSAIFSQGVPEPNPNPVKLELGEVILPSGSFTSAHQEWMFSELVGGIVRAQQGIQHVHPELGDIFENSIREWIAVYEKGSEWEKRDQIIITDALEALREAISSLDRDGLGFDPAIRESLKELFLDNLLLIGLINSVYGKHVMPNYLTDYPGVVLGALLHFLAIDVTNPYKS